jgi:hypothetical protein
VLLSRAVLDLGSTVAMVAAPSQFRVKGVSDAGVDSAHLLPTDARNDVLLCLAAVVLAGLESKLRVVEVLIDQLLHCRIRARMALGTYLGDELRLDPLDLPLLVRAGWDGLA